MRLSGTQGTSLNTTRSEVVNDFVAAMRAGDATAAQLVLTGEPVSDGFFHWLTALDTSGVEFFDCSYRPAAVRCNTTIGPDFWFERIHGANAESFFAGGIEGVKIQLVSWMATVEDIYVNSDFRIWVAENHPEHTDVIFDGTTIGYLTIAAAEARLELLDEYLASLSG